MTGSHSRTIGAAVVLGLAALACSAAGISPAPEVPPTPFYAPTLTRPASDGTPATSTAPPPQPSVTSPRSTGGVLVDFEEWGAWRRGDQPNGAFEQSDERAVGGRFSGRLSYDFPTTGNDFVVFVQQIPIPGTADRIHGWVYGDASGHFLNVWVRDAEGEVWQTTFGRIDHEGWQWMTAEIRPGQDWPWGHISGPANDAVDYPISFYALVLDDGEDDFVGGGTVFVDDIAVP